MTLTKEDLKAIKELFAPRFDAIDARFDGVDDRFDAIDARFDGVDSRLDKHDAKFVSIGDRFDSIDKQLLAMRQDISDLAISTSKQFQQVDERFNDSDAKLEKLGDDVVVIKEMVKDHSFRIARLEHRIAPPA